MKDWAFVRFIDMQHEAQLVVGVSYRMEISCQVCGSRLIRSDDGLIFCKACASHAEEYDRNQAMSGAGHFVWNTSQHDPSWRTWLTSSSLYEKIKEIVPAVATHRLRLLGGDLYSYDSGLSCRIDAWISPDGVIVAYPIWSSNTLFEACDRIDFGLWIHHLYHSEPLPLGQIRCSDQDGRFLKSSSYGARASMHSGAAPIIMWAQAGDWAALFRHWQFRLDGRATE